MHIHFVMKYIIFEWEMGIWELMYVYLFVQIYIGRQVHVYISQKSVNYMFPNFIS
jgi:hypothetical protein